ncbi:hypothetical protein NZL82_17935 [Sphingomonas sanguinis]|uniref:hypothetical protein n=1 Tax=Sphingomonas sp. LC-1 TaxID=3110957 RepID=UPI0021BB8488|nr:hypothetical protein [Sphingomonas sp. LC-1]MCT8003756.1 hypothetical protein [Sphingomonas sp. LC-1]
MTLLKAMHTPYDDDKFSSNRKSSMPYGYFLPPRKARLCRLAGVLFLLSAAVMPVVIAAAGLTPGAGPICGGGYGCVWNARAATLLPEESRMLIEMSPPARAQFDAHVARTDVRIGLTAIAAIDLLPFMALLSSVGVALRRLGGSGADTLERALPWLRRASLAAIVWTLAGPVHQSALETWLSPGMPSGFQIITTILLAPIAGGLLLAFAAYAAIWAVEAALKARRDLDRFV